MKLPTWLYLKREDDYLTVVRYGRMPLVLTIIKNGPRMHGHMPPSYLFACGRLGIQYGPADGITEGWADMPRDSKHKLFEFKSGLAVGVTWDGKR
jgi:hypothetical protein